MFIALLDVFRVNVFGKGLENLLVLVEFEGFLDLVRLLDKVTDFCLELLTDFVFFAHLVKVLKFFLLLFIVCLHLADDRPHVVDVIRKRNAAESFNEY